MSNRTPTEAPNPIPLNLRSEHGKLEAAIVLSDPENAIDLSWEMHHKLIAPEELARHPETGEVSARILRQQHQAYMALLKSAGVQLYEPTLEKDAFCQVFARDPAFAVNDQLFIASMRDGYRFAEVQGLGELRRRFSKVIELTDHDTKNESRQIVEGGDVMPFDEGNSVLIGTGQITNENGYEALARRLRQSGVQEVVRVPHEALHLDCCFAPLPNGESIVSSQVPAASREILKRYFPNIRPADEEEALQRLALNIFWLNPETVVSNENVPKTNDLLQQLGYDVRRLPYDQPTHEWGSFRCTVGPLSRAKAK